MNNVIPVHRLQGAPIRSWGRIIERYNRAPRVQSSRAPRSRLRALRNGVGAPNWVSPEALGLDAPSGR